jgi:hypothetical protein
MANKGGSFEESSPNEVHDSAPEEDLSRRVRYKMGRPMR